MSPLLRVANLAQFSLLSLVASLTLLSPAAAIDWIGAVGDFNDGANWQGGDVPSSGDEALINNGGTAQLNGDADMQALRLGVGGGQGNFEMSGGLLSAAGAFLGDTGTAQATLSGGEFVIGNDSIHVGMNPGGVGVLNIEGADTLVTSGDDFQLGRDGTGTLNFSAGTLRAGYTVIGKFGTGLWNQTGGMFDQDFGDVEIGDGGRDDQSATPGPRIGTLNLLGGFLQTSDSLAIGNRRGGGEVIVSGGALLATGKDDSSIFIGRGMDSSPGVGGDTALRIRGSGGTIVATGSLLMNPNDVSQSSTLIAEITGLDHSPIVVGGSADVSNGTLKVELSGYAPKSNDSWLLVQAGAELDAILESIDQQVDAAGYDPLTHGFAAIPGEILGPFQSIDTTLAPLAAGLSWDVAYTSDLIVLSVIGTAGPTGDFNQNGVLDAGDIDDLTTQSASGTNPLAYDLNADNLVNETDVDTWIVDLFNSWVGDANLDGEFNSGDLVIVLASGTYEADVASVWTTGDFNGDGRTNSSDLVAALAGGGYEAGPRAAVQAVPEPATLILLLPGLLLLARRSR
jgi:T5SS/PEP-CTERM-associated repeat protein